jgi:hypothetical protein
MKKGERAMPRTDLAVICRCVSDLADREDVEEFAIGTTVDLLGAKAALRAEGLISIYEADTPEDAAEVEQALLARFASNAKCAANEEAYEADSNTLDDDSTLSVFVAIWWRT